MKQLLRNSTTWTVLGAIVAAISFITIMTLSTVTRTSADHKGSLVTIHDRGIDKTIATNDATIGDALRDAGFTMAKEDVVEPSADQKIVAAKYQVNIYRARPVIVVDGATREKVITPYQTSSQIAQSVGIQLYPEDQATITRSSNIVSDGAGLEMDIIRAVPFQFDLYGSTTTARTQAKTVGDMLKEKGITIGASDGLSPDISTPITANMNVRIWREGKQTITSVEAVPFDTQTTYDANQPIGYRQIVSAGVEGTQNVTYEIDVEKGKEVSRTKIAAIVTQPAVTQVVVVGVKSTGGLTQSRGADFFTDSNGVVHRETYYDLNMHSVATNCGNGGTYIIRADGVKVDNNGYVMIAADLARYPRCSVQQTSVGLAKVYDTGGFVARYPDGWDIATDWSDNNGI
jgi:uncharacterized protein YabE (DUF348 family)